jgi:hypothetical protein
VHVNRHGGEYDNSGPGRDREAGRHADLQKRRKSWGHYKRFQRFQRFQGFWRFKP